MPKTKKNKKRSGANINRRSFLKGIAATGAMGTIATAHPAAAAQFARQEETVTKTWRDKPDPIDERLISDGGTYDVVVVGAGNAGLICARAAAASMLIRAGKRMTIPTRKTMVALPITIAISSAKIDPI